VTTHRSRRRIRPQQHDETNQPAEAVFADNAHVAANRPARRREAGASKSGEPWKHKGAAGADNDLVIGVAPSKAGAGTMTRFPFPHAKGATSAGQAALHTAAPGHAQPRSQPDQMHAETRMRVSTGDVPTNLLLAIRRALGQYPRATRAPMTSCGIPTIRRTAATAAAMSFRGAIASS
jgi:hypothetical protein